MIGPDVDIDQNFGADISKHRKWLKCVGQQ